MLVSCLMVWVVTRLLRWLFPQRFGSKTVPVKKPAAKKTTKKAEGEEKAEKAPAKKPAAKKTAKKDAE